MRDKVKLVRVKPIDGVIVRDPSSFAPMPEGGMDVVLKGRHGKFWRRRINDGSLVIVSSKVTEKPKVVKPKIESREDKD